LLFAHFEKIAEAAPACPKRVSKIEVGRAGIASPFEKGGSRGIFRADLSRAMLLKENAA
jgi:hypothetical protein